MKKTRLLLCAAVGLVLFSCGKEVETDPNAVNAANAQATATAQQRGSLLPGTQTVNNSGNRNSGPLVIFKNRVNYTIPEYFRLAGDPIIDLGKTGDFYINVNNDNVYRKTRNGLWTLIHTGTNREFYIESDRSDVKNPQYGDFFIDRETRDVYFYGRNNRWVLRLDGIECHDDGDDGDQGGNTTVTGTYVIPAEACDAGNDCSNLRSRLNRSYQNRDLALPYNRQAKGTNATVQNIFNTQVNKGKKVVNAQVIFSFDLKDYDLSDKKIVSIKLDLDMKKNYYDDAINPKTGDATEILCLLNTKVCSGSVYAGKNSFKKLINQKFFKSMTGNTANRDFSSLFPAKKPKKASVRVTRSGSNSLDLAQLLDYNEEKMRLIINKDNQIDIVIADDVRLLKLPKLLIKYESTEVY